jgi:hypothetical protein
VLGSSAGFSPVVVAPLEFSPRVVGFGAETDHPRGKQALG